VTVEAASPLGWDRWAGDEGTIIGIDHYGASAPGEEVMKHFGFTVEHVTSAALYLLGRKGQADRERGAETAAGPTAPSEGHS
jgi:transketolase